MRNIKAILNFQTNYEVLKITTPTQISKGKYFEKHQTYNPNTKRCSLCLNKKLEIAGYKGHNLLNKRSEIINKCRHRNKFALALYDRKD